MLTSGKPSPLDYNDTLTNYPSIFNDVIGPVMRGSSSSLCAAALRIGRMASNLWLLNIINVNNKN